MTDKSIGSFAFVLHSHLPYVLAHGKWPHGTDWLNEAVAETYIPILNVLNELIEEGLQPKFTIGISPILAEQLADESFKSEFVDYLQIKIEAAITDEEDFRRYNLPQMQKLARLWRDYYTKIKTDFESRYSRDLIGALKELLAGGYIDIITSGATHGYLPLLSQDTSVQAQVKMAVKAHKRHFGIKPRGIWLPECAYRPRYNWVPPVDSILGESPYPRKGIDEFLSENDLDYFFIDTALLRGGKAIGVYIDRFEALRRLWRQFEKEIRVREEEVEKSPYDIYLVSSSPEGKRPVAVLTRDPKTGLQVWSGEWGYPGDGWYLEFHKKHFPGGHRYWRVTSANSDLADKMEYFPEKAAERLQENSSHFVWLIKTILREHFEQRERKGVVVAPYDSELFGHWWFEGPQFLKNVLAWLGKDPQVDLTTAAEEVDLKEPVEVVSLPEGSWGEGGYHYIWLNEDTSWTWKHIYEDEVKMQRTLQELDYKRNEGLQEILKQAARELLLLQASDWQFLITTWSARDYAETRFYEHHTNFLRLIEAARRFAREGSLHQGDWSFLKDCQQRDAIFPDIELDWFKELEYPIES